jgi:hypothetical protein
LDCFLIIFFIDTFRPFVYFRLWQSPMTITYIFSHILFKNFILWHLLNFPIAIKLFSDFLQDINIFKFWENCTQIHCPCHLINNSIRPFVHSQFDLQNKQSCLPCNMQNGIQFRKSNGRDNGFEYNFLKIWRYLYLVKNQRIIL